MIDFILGVELIGIRDGLGDVVVMVTVGPKEVIDANQT